MMRTAKSRDMAAVADSGGGGTRAEKEPLLEPPERESRLVSKESQVRTMPVEKWTNTEVVKWLLDIDQKVFVPAMITQNISGATLLQLTREQLQKVTDDLKQGEHSVQTLWNHIDTLKTKSDTETWGTDKDDIETFGRLLSHPTGWTFDREYNEWVDFLEIYNEEAITIHIEASLKKYQNYFQVLVLMVSSVATLCTSTSFAGIFEKGEDAANSTDFGLYAQVCILVFTFLTTITSGYVQIRGAAWKDQLAVIAEYQAVADKLTSLYEDNLAVPLNDRLPFAEYNAQVKQLWSSMPARLDFSPGQRNDALIDIKLNDPTVWKRGFQFMESSSGWKCWPSRIISLIEPVGDAYDAMLMRFSGEDMGEYTAKPEIFKQDKKDAQARLRTMQKRTGDIQGYED